MKKIGIVGGGQLGKMMILDAKRMDYYFVILDPTKNCPADSIANEHIVADFNDMDAMLELASKVDVVTFEFEHINVNALIEMENKGIKVFPSSETLLHIQNKYNQKKWLKDNGLPVPDFYKIDSYEELCKAHEKYGFPVILKTCTGGYDGKGNAVINNEDEYLEAYKALGNGSIPLMAEQCVDFQKEVSVLVCQSTNGDIKVFPIAENLHKNSILDETIVPADISEDSVKEALEIARKTVKVVNAYGMLCIELFVCKDGKILINELAPRPHNSGHYTIEGCITSQYENHIRAILGLPLGETTLIKPTVMKNIIGEKSSSANVVGIENAYKYPNVQVHIYGKETVSKGRKMGHVTVLDDSVEEALKVARFAHSQISFLD